MAQATVKEVLPAYDLIYDGMPARYVRDARSGDVGYHPGQPKQVIIEIEPIAGETPRETRVPADQLTKGPDDAVRSVRAWPPVGVPSPESERRELQRKADDDRIKGILDAPEAKPKVEAKAEIEAKEPPKPKPKPDDDDEDGNGPTKKAAKK